MDDKPAQEITSMWGIGDLVMNRAVIRELMKSRTVYLRTHNPGFFHDLFAEGLKLSSLQPDARVPVIKESSPPPPLTPPLKRVNPPVKIGYRPQDIIRIGNVPGTMFANFSLPVPDTADFSLPVPDAWRARVRERIGDTHGKPVMVYRPPVNNVVFNPHNRAPDLAAYAALYESIRGQFHTVGVASLKPEREWIIGPKSPVDLDLMHGELDLEGLVGLFAEADLAFVNMGFAPWLSQAVGTPTVCVYGGHESYRSTHASSATLAPTLGIDPDSPCDCHQYQHNCNKSINVPRATARLADFVDRNVSEKRIQISDKRVLIFATTYVDSPSKAKLLNHWITLADRNAPWVSMDTRGCDVLLVDTPADGWNEPLVSRPFETHTMGVRSRFSVHRFPDNLGHLTARPSRDGWGRAFTYGLEAAIAGGYDYVVHIEGDSLFRLPVMPIIGQMERHNYNALSVPVTGIRQKYDLGTEIETGLMFFRVPYLVQSNFTAAYNWEAQTFHRPSPEHRIHDILGPHLTLMPWSAQRGDHNIFTPENVCVLDWITHAPHPAMYENFMRGRSVHIPATADGVPARAVVRAPMFNRPPAVPPAMRQPGANPNVAMRQREALLRSMGLKA